MIRAEIIGTGSYIPEKTLTNKDLEKMVDTSDNWITKRTGIKERHIAAGDQASSDLAVEAAKKAIADAGIDKDEIDIIICATITPDMVFPATACQTQKKLEIKDVAAFDVEAACTGFLTALAIADSMIVSGNFNKVLVVASEVLSRITDWDDRQTCVLFGDGAGAAILSATDEDRGIMSSYLGADGNYDNILHLPAGGSKLPASQETVKEGLHYMKMEGRETFKIAVKKMAQSVRIALKKAGLTIDEIKMVIPHQANMRIIKALAKRLKIDIEKVFVNIQDYGNMSAATTAVGLDEALRGGNISEGDIIQLVAFGGGLTWGSITVKI
ncbi:MAG: ketoacyl-ACP synthase III [Elusimicrobia bacterium]|jgi:3-oxoacyl-[acyl-carrier-protein] synthase-3|nr:ketoacyl-ACP synthase III [Elusimicrobiota bacterium]